MEEGEKKTRPHSSNKPWFLVHICPRRPLWWQYRCSRFNSSVPPLDNAVSQCTGHLTPISEGFNSQIKLAWLWPKPELQLSHRRHTRVTGWLCLHNGKESLCLCWSHLCKHVCWLRRVLHFLWPLKHLIRVFFFPSNWLCHVGNERFPEAELRSVHVCWWRRK